MALTAEEARRAVLVLHRFGLGAKQAGLTAALARDPRGALLDELRDPGRAVLVDPALPTSQDALARHFDEAEAERMQRQTAESDQREMRRARGRNGIEGLVPPQAMAGTMDKPAAPQPAPAMPQVEQVIYRAEALARLRKATEPAIGLAERLVLFWSNHFCISVQKGQIARATAGALEREAIRPNVLGRFTDMLLAVEKHPAMLFYLDNRQSVGPNSRAGQNRRVGRNENLAREILELHTLGVDGGYSQADVIALANMITGWTFVGPAERQGPAGSFVFTPNRHEPGDQTLLGKVYREGGVEQGEAALRDLARHPATARHIARKLARHFISDTPPQPIIDHLAEVFRATEGHLGEVSKALISHPEALRGEMSKVRTPYEWLAAIARFGGVPKEPGQILQPLNALGQPLFAVPGPNGFADTAAHWGSPESLRARLDLSAAIARRISADMNPSELAGELFGEAMSAESRQAIRRAESRHQGLAILMMTPEFMRR